MTTPSDPDRASKADEYRHPDGTREVVFATENGAVLTVREYRSTEAFEAAVADADYQGTHARVSDLSGVEAFEERPAADED